MVKLRLAERYSAMNSTFSVKKVRASSSPNGLPTWSSPVQTCTTIDDEPDRVKAENDWTAQRAARYPTRLRASVLAKCSFRPWRNFESPAHRSSSACGARPQVRAREPGELRRIELFYEDVGRHRRLLSPQASQGRRSQLTSASTVV